MRISLPSAVVGTILALPASLAAQQQSAEFTTHAHPVAWRAKATDAHLIGGYGDNFSYDGSKVTTLSDGVAYLDVNAETNQGWLMAKFKGTIHPAKDQTYSGDITLFYPVFMGSGPEYWEGGVADYEVLHGNTGREAPIMPSTPAYLASWGPAIVVVDGKQVFMGAGHMMLTERTRDPETQAIYADGAHHTFYSPMHPDQGVMVDPQGKELHFIVRSNDSDEDNFPKFGFFLHVNYENVQVDAPIPAAVRQQAAQMQAQAMKKMPEKGGR